MALHAMIGNEENRSVTRNIIKKVVAMKKTNKMYKTTARLYQFELRIISSTDKSIKAY